MDPLLLNADYGSVLVLGKTGSGKTTLVHKALNVNIAKKNISFL